MRNDPELAHIADGLPDIPELFPENEASWFLWMLISDQVRLDRDGAFALDLGAVDRVMERFDFDDGLGELVKMRALFKIDCERKER